MPELTIVRMASVGVCTCLVRLVRSSATVKTSSPSRTIQGEESLI